MNKSTAVNAMKFMERVTLQGAEVPAYFEVMQALDAIANAPEAQAGNVTTIGRAGVGGSAPGAGTTENGDAPEQQKGPSHGRV